MSSLQTLIMKDNFLTGDLHQSFSEQQKSLEIIDLSSNRFSSSIPATIFKLPKIRTITLVKNCFSGSLPEDICDSKVQELFMDGLSTGEVRFASHPSNPRLRLLTQKSHLGLSYASQVVLF